MELVQEMNRERIDRSRSLRLCRFVKWMVIVVVVGILGTVLGLDELCQGQARSSCEIDSLERGNLRTVSSVAGCAGSEANMGNRFAKMDVVAASVQGQTEFTLELHKAVVQGKESENAVLSPLSISLALAMAAAGAKGPTLAQIAKCIKLPVGDPMHKFSAQLNSTVLADDSAAGGPQVALANRAWVDQSVKLKPRFQKILKDSYGSEAASVNFSSKVPNTDLTTIIELVQEHISLRQLTKSIML